MEILKTKLEGVYIIKNKVFSDKRGKFIKTYHKEEFEKLGLCTDFKESYFSVSNKNVIRGMHFQLPPMDHEKLIYVAKGKVKDIILDLRSNSKTKGEYIEVELSEKNGCSIYISKGLAHGFRAVEDNTIMVYNVATVYNQECDYGIKYDSFGYEWDIENPILSNRDKNFETLEEFLKKGVF